MNAQNINLLVVDSNAADRNLISRYAGNMHASVVATAANGEDALSMYKLYRPNAVIMDLDIPGWGSPDEGALTCIRKIIEFDRAANILILSAAGNRHAGIRAVAAGARAFLNKPVNADRLFTVLHEIMAEPAP